VVGYAVGLFEVSGSMCTSTCSQVKICQATAAATALAQQDKGVITKLSFQV